MYNTDLNERYISYTMEGKSFNDGYDFNDTLVALNYFQNIIDKAYLTIVNKDRISKTDRAIYKIRATDIRQGSFIADLMLFTGAAIQITYPIINTYYPSLILDITKQGFEYLKMVLKADKEGKKVSVSGVESGDVMVINIDGNNTGPIYIGSKAFAFADKAFDDIRSLSEIIDDKNIKKINVFDKTDNREIIKLGIKERDIFKIEPKLDEIPVSIIGIIFRIDVRAKSGKMLVTESNSESLPNGEFIFEIMVDEDIEKCCSVIGKGAKFGVLRKIQYDPIALKDQVKSIKIFKVDIAYSV